MFARRKPAIVVPLDVVEPSLGPVVNPDGTPTPTTLRMFGRLPDHEPEWVRRAREQRLVVRVEGGSARS